MFVWFSFCFCSQYYLYALRTQRHRCITIECRMAYPHRRCIGLLHRRRLKPPSRRATKKDSRFFEVEADTLHTPMEPSGTLSRSKPYGLAFMILVMLFPAFRIAKCHTPGPELPCTRSSILSYLRHNQQGTLKLSFDYQKASKAVTHLLSLCTPGDVVFILIYLLLLLYDLY